MDSFTHSLPRVGCRELGLARVGGCHFGTILLYVSRSHFMCPVLTLCVRPSLYVSGSHFMCPIVFCQFLTLCVPFSKKNFFFQKCHFRMFLDPLNPNLASVLRFEASVSRYVNFYHENVDFLKIRVNVFFGLFVALNTNCELVLLIRNIFTKRYVKMSTSQNGILSCKMRFFCMYGSLNPNIAQAPSGVDRKNFRGGAIFLFQFFYMNKSKN